MRQKTRKILSRMGAVLLLGLSFLNFGSSWGGQRAKGIPRRTQNIKKQEKEELDEETKEVADIAEKEAIDVINQTMQKQDQQQQLQQQAQTQTKQTLKYVAIGGWGLAMTIFFTSMIFNQPFGLGKAVLSLLPGEPHVAVLETITTKKVWQIGESNEVIINLATNKEKVNYFKIVAQYNPEIIEFQKINFDKSRFDNLEQSLIDQKVGKITMIIKKKGFGGNFKKDKIATITFKALQKKDKVRVKLIQKESLVLKTKKEDNKGYNILGKTKSAQFKIVDKFSQIIKCQQIDIVKSRMNKRQWEWLINSAPIPLKNGNDWVELSKNTSLLCAYFDKESIYVLIHSNKKINKINLENRLTGEKVLISKKEDWLNKSSYFYTRVFDSTQILKNKKDNFKNIVISLEEEGKTIRWPKKGFGEVMLMQKK